MISISTSQTFRSCVVIFHLRQPMAFLSLNSDLPTNQTFHQFHDLYTELDLHRIMSGFHGAFATGVASQQGTLTLPDTWFRPPFWDLLMLQLLETKFLELAMSLLDFSPRIPLGTFSILLIRYARACSSFECFILRARRLSSKLLKQGYLVERLKSSFRKFYGRYGDLIQQYEVSLSRMLNDILILDQQ